MTDLIRIPLTRSGDIEITPGAIAAIAHAIAIAADLEAARGIVEAGQHPRNSPPLPMDNAPTPADAGDEAAVQAMIDIIGADIEAADARAILAAIKAGKVPGVCCDAWAGQAQAIMAERDQLRAELDQYRTASEAERPHRERAQREQTEQKYGRLGGSYLGNALDEIARLKADLAAMKCYAEGLARAGCEQAGRADDNMTDIARLRSRIDELQADKDQIARVLRCPPHEGPLMGAQRIMSYVDAIGSENDNLVAGMEVAHKNYKDATARVAELERAASAWRGDMESAGRMCGQREDEYPLEAVTRFSADAAQWKERAEKAEALNRQRGIACTKHDIVHAWACPGCLEDATARLAQVERDLGEAMGALADMRAVLSLCDQGRAGRVEDHIDAHADALGRANGYGAWMDALQRAWQLRDDVGCHTVGPCLGTVRHALKRIDALLSRLAKPEAGKEAAP